jgi:hypothetical protein
MTTFNKLDMARFRDAPPWMKLTAEEELDAAIVLTEAILEFKPEGKDLVDLVWWVAVQGVRRAARVAAVRQKRKKTGPKKKRKWSNGLGLSLAFNVEDELNQRGWKSSDRGAVERVIADLRKHPFWKQFTEHALWQAYYAHRDKGRTILNYIHEMNAPIEEWRKRLKPGP